MSVRSIDNEGDWTFGKGKNNYKSGIEEIKQNISTRINSWKNDCFFELNAGVDYNNFLDVGTKDFLDRDVKRVILQTKGVMKIISFDSEINDRELDGEATILTIYGPMTMEF